MEITQEQSNGIAVLALHGRLDELATRDAEATFQEVIDEGPNDVVLDLSGVEYVSSSGLRVLVMLLRGLQKNSGALKVCCLSPFVAEVFEVSNLNAMFDIYERRDEALAAFAG